MFILSLEWPAPSGSVMFAWGVVGVKFRRTLRRPAGTTLGVGPDRGPDRSPDGRKTPELKTPEHLLARLYFFPVPCNDAYSVASPKLARKVHDHSLTLVARMRVENTEPRASASGPASTKTEATLFRDATLRRA